MHKNSDKQRKVVCSCPVLPKNLLLDKYDDNPSLIIVQIHSEKHACTKTWSEGSVGRQSQNHHHQTML